jgi:hypothetical protein
MPGEGAVVYTQAELKEMDTDQLVELADPVFKELENRVPSHRQELARDIDRAWSTFKGEIGGTST